MTMLRGISQRAIKTIHRDGILHKVKRSYSERRRRKGDGTKTDIFEERSAASQEEYFRKETARQLKKIKEKQKQQGEELKKQLEDQSKHESQDGLDKKKRPS